MSNNGHTRAVLYARVSSDYRTVVFSFPWNSFFQYNENIVAPGIECRERNLVRHKNIFRYILSILSTSL